MMMVASAALSHFVVDGDFATFYDNLVLPKGPSLGCDFPLAMSYTLLAHWDLVKEAEQKTLNAMGISPWLIRLSVGEDSPQLIIAAMEHAFQKLRPF
jgi:cystathionine gamma-synthase